MIFQYPNVSQTERSSAGAGSIGSGSGGAMAGTAAGLQTPPLRLISISLARLSEWCASRFNQHDVKPDPNPRPYDVPWLVLDSSRAEAEWSWRPAPSLEAIVNEIAEHAERRPEWLDLSQSA